MVMEATSGNRGSDMSSPVSYLSSRSKSQGVIGCGEAKAEAKASARSAAMRQGRRGKSRSVTPNRPEAVVSYTRAGRSWSDDQWRPATNVGIFHLGDLGVGVIVLSNTAIAGSLRNVSQHSVPGERYGGRAPIGRNGSERGRHPLKLRIPYLCRRGQLRSSG